MRNIINQSGVAVAKAESRRVCYPEAPFDPPEIYPEFIGTRTHPLSLNTSNHLYSQVRQLLANMDLDDLNFGQEHWNPLNQLVKKGSHVVIKPNLVYDDHPLGQEGVEAMVTHASVVRPLIDYILLASQGDVKITICDVPLQTTNWEKLIEKSGFRDLVNYYHCQGVEIHLRDLRFEISLKNREGLITKRDYKERDPLGYRVVDLKDRSAFQPIIRDSSKLEITDYGPGTVSKHHNDLKNEYLVSGTVLDADLFINIPKMKTHRKAGVTLSLKNLVGINGDKSWIAHHRKGVDEYPFFNFKSYTKWYLSYYLKNYAPLTVTNLVYRLYRKTCLRGKSIKAHSMEHGGILMEGNWHGNDTIWRTILDLNRILLYSDSAGKLQETTQRRYLSIVDGWIGMEGEGPMDGVPVRGGLIVGGLNPVAVDWVSAYLMGMEPTAIPQIREAFNLEALPLTSFHSEEIEIFGENWRSTNLNFTPSRGWKNHIERQTKKEAQQPTDAQLPDV